MKYMLIMRATDDAKKAYEEMDVNEVITKMGQYNEQLIKAGRVRVNGHLITELGAKADPRRDRIEVDGRRVVAEERVYVALHKPRGVVSTMSDPEGRPTVRELLSSIGAVSTRSGASTSRRAACSWRRTTESSPTPCSTRRRPCRRRTWSR